MNPGALCEVLQLSSLMAQSPSNPPLARRSSHTVERWTDPTDIGFIRRFLGTDAANNYVVQAVYTHEEVSDETRMKRRVC